MARVPAREDPSGSLAVRIAIDGLQGGTGQSAALSPIAILLAGDRAAPIGVTEWQQATLAPRFATVLSLPDHARTPLRLQVRHVADPLWDAAGTTDAVLQAMPLVGQGVFSLDAALAACASGQPLKLSLSTPELAEAPVATTAAPLAYLTFTRPLPEEPWSRWSLPDALSLQHSSANFCFARDPSVQLRVAEHMLSCGAGYTVPRATLRMLTEEVRRRVQTGRDTDETSERDGADDGEVDPWRLVGCLSTAGWRHLLGWLEQALAQLHGAFQHAHGFKASTIKTNAALGAMPINLMLNVLDVSEAQRGNSPYNRSMHATVSAGAFSAHSLGFSDGGAAALEAKLLQQLSKPPTAPRGSAASASAADQLLFGVAAAASGASGNGHSGGGGVAVPANVDGSADALALPFARRLALLACQAFSALAASFAASCRLRVAPREENTAWFAQIRSVGYLLHVESLLSTRGDEWGMLQDVTAACRLLSHVRLAVRTDDESASAESAGWHGVASDVSVGGTRRRPVIELSPRDLGFRDAAHAASMGLGPGSLVEVVAVLVTQGINEEQSMASLMRTNTAEQQALNLRAARRLRAYSLTFAEMLAKGVPPSPAAEPPPPTPSPPPPPQAQSQPPSSPPPLPRSFIDSALPSRAAFEASLALPPAERAKLELAAAASRGLLTSAPTTTAQASPPGADDAYGAAPFRYVSGGAAPRPPMAPAARLRLIQARVEEVGVLVRSQPAESKNIQLLEASAEAARLLGGGRVTMCKSGKDRTSMSVTLEHGRLLRAVHGLKDPDDAVHTMRRRGVRRENVRLNTGRRLYAFNWLQQSMLPEPYRPPKGSASGGKG